MDAAAAEEIPDGHLCLKLARAYLRCGDPAAAWSWLVRVLDAPDDFMAWSAAAGLLARVAEHATPRLGGRHGSYTITQLTGMLRLVALHSGSG